LIEIRRVRFDEWQALRDLRLHALEDAPSAFATRLDEARVRPEQWWQEWAARSAEGRGQAMFLGWEGEVPRGIAGTFVENDGRRWLISMWTEPAARGLGVGRALVEAIAAFARAAGSTELLLEVTAGNDAAHALYRSCGFVDEGAGDPHDDGEPTIRMRLVL
jgi:GNAT superfamily N-acetyltransferase